MRQAGLLVLVSLCLVAACKSKPAPPPGGQETPSSVAAPSPAPGAEVLSGGPSGPITPPPGFTDPEKVRKKTAGPLPVSKEEFEGKIDGLKKNCLNSTEPLDLKAIVGQVPSALTYAVCMAATEDKPKRIGELVAGATLDVSEKTVLYEIWRDVTVPAVKGKKPGRKILRDTAIAKCRKLFPQPDRRKDLDLCVQRMDTLLRLTDAKGQADCEGLGTDFEDTACRAYVSGNKNVCADLRDKEKKRLCHAAIGPLLALSRSAPDQLRPLGRDTTQDELLAYLYFDDSACKKYLDTVVRPAYCEAQAGTSFGMRMPLQGEGK